MGVQRKVHVADVGTGLQLFVRSAPHACIDSKHKRIARTTSCGLSIFNDIKCLVLPEKAKHENEQICLKV